MTQAPKSRREYLQETVDNMYRVYNKWAKIWNWVYSGGVVGSVITSLAAGASATDLATGEQLLQVWDLSRETQLTVTAMLAFAPTFFALLSSGLKAETERKVNRQSRTNTDLLRTLMRTSNISNAEINNKIVDIRQKHDAATQ